MSEAVESSMPTEPEALEGEREVLAQLLPVAVEILVPHIKQKFQESRQYDVHFQMPRWLQKERY